MLHLEIKKGKEAMKTSEFQKYIGGTAALMNRLAMATKGCGKITSNETYFSDIFFSFVKTSEEEIPEGVDYCGPEKRIHKSFCLSTFENLMKYCPGGKYIFMKSTPRFSGGIPLLAIEYKYNSRKVLGFIDTEGGGIT